MPEFPRLKIEIGQVKRNGGSSIQRLALYPKVINIDRTQTKLYEGKNEITLSTPNGQES
jgi:hypothetical protein